MSRNLHIQRRLTGWLIGILLLITNLTYSQTTEVPNWVIDSIVDELIVKDGLVYKVQMQDSIIQVFEENAERDRKIIGAYKLKDAEYQAIVERQAQENKFLTAENKDLTKENRRIRFGNGFFKLTTTVEAVAIIILLILIL